MLIRLILCVIVSSAGVVIPLACCALPPPLEQSLRYRYISRRIVYLTTRTTSQRRSISTAYEGGYHGMIPK